MKEFNATVGPEYGYGVTILVGSFPQDRCGIELSRGDGSAVAATSLGSSELDALILALQGAQAILHAPK